MKTRWRSVRGANAAVHRGSLWCAPIASHFCKRDLDLSHVRLAQAATGLSRRNELQRLAAAPRGKPVLVFHWRSCSCASSVLIG